MPQHAPDMTARAAFANAVRGADGFRRRPWRIRPRLSRLADRCERFLAEAGFDRGPWITVAFAAGIGMWFALPRILHWLMAMGLLAAAAGIAQTAWGKRDDRAMLRIAVTAISTMLMVGLALVWARSELVGAPPVAHPMMQRMEARILSLDEQPAEGRVRIVIAARDAETGAAVKYRINVPYERVVPGLEDGAQIRLSARLMPPSPPLLPGAYDFARAAWFQGYAATGSLVGDITIVRRGEDDQGSLSRLQRTLAGHVRSQIEGSSGTIAAALASGDRGAIARADEDAMRDAGLTHLLSISGLHVSALIGAAYIIALKLLALSPWLTLRIRLPLAAAGFGALAGVAYTLLTGAEVPTVRSCIGAILVLGALVLGREPLSLRMVSVAAALVLALWPEALVGPSFQMSFAAVIAIVALHGSDPVRRFLAPREEPGVARLCRRMAMLFITGIVIELALTPIVLFHFHRAGLYGAFANVVAIPLVTFVSMPLIALALFLDLIGAGRAVWWLAGGSLDLLLAIAHFTAAQPGAVKLVPYVGLGPVLLFLAGSVWLALWRGRRRLWGAAPMAFAAALLATAPVPDVLITRDGRELGLTDAGGRLYLLRNSEGGYARDNLIELGGSEAQPLTIRQWPGARCTSEFCSLTMTRGVQDWHLLIARNRHRIDERQLAAACEKAHVVIADRWLPRSCRPLWLKADRNFLADAGGAALFLETERIHSVRNGPTDHGWSAHDPSEQAGRRRRTAPANQSHQ
ncbi:ComEC/Rec2 family competence protein [Qipengyuania sp.]|uniref:ComEC/Rec2 family competence protein n=1 Tax=Qipengyuania sp. TaxID=2004515 RepID=UPI003735FAB7